ncbi:hypothetical protein MUP77_08575 [Candidatus Bathyarchaeota archaeon]|nr:hypothetical protein [Candidatus Bathyarchaeota archaeon]
MEKKIAIRLMLATLIFLSLWDLAHSATDITFRNESGGTLYIYYVISKDSTIYCNSFRCAGNFEPGDTWECSVPDGSYGWFRFQKSTIGKGCYISENTFEITVRGKKGYNPEHMSVYSSI